MRFSAITSTKPILTSSSPISQPIKLYWRLSTVKIASTWWTLALRRGGPPPLRLTGIAPQSSNSGGCACRFKDSSAVASPCATSSCGPINVEESASSYKFRTPNMATSGKVLRFLSTNENASTSDLAASGSGHEIDISENRTDKLNPGHLNLHNSNC
ncbi:hypothetical protein K2173_000926 [Erythroxylum novogranatense]|uniref:Uncharacterized protein n=1 Tax=Erythroxylum novogranatense TaxID=1862640 RepID=A0AAV8TQD0_9ROSI|nr:hypothetical protein K2173_000926 [Erythroxylum novogranatense]